MEAVNTNFYSHGLTRLGIEPESTVSAADSLDSYETRRDGSTRYIAIKSLFSF